MSPRELSSTRRFFLWSAIVGCLAMALACVIPTFLGAEAATEWFVSPFGATVWWAFGLLIVVSIIVIGALRRRLGLLAMHLGMVLVIVGAMWGSPMMHRVRASLWDDPKQYKSFLIIEEGSSSRQLLDLQQMSAAQLPFDVYLKQFWIDYYPPSDDELWAFTVEAIAPGDEHGMGQAWQSIRVDWTPGEKVRLPLCEVDLLVTNYQLTQYGTGADAPILPEVTLELSRGEDKIEKVFQPQMGMPHVRLPLGSLYGTAGAWHDAGQPALQFRPPTRVIKDFKSDLIVYQDGKEIASKTIEVNVPLHVGGYYFYQHDYDHARGLYTILSVSSDSGLSVVYVGFILLAGGLALRVLMHKRKLNGPALSSSKGGV